MTKERKFAMQQDEIRAMIKQAQHDRRPFQKLLMKIH